MATCVLERLSTDCALNFGVECAAGMLPADALYALQLNSEVACEAAQHATGFGATHHDWLPASIDVQNVDMGDGQGQVHRLRIMNRNMYDECEGDHRFVLLRLEDDGVEQKVEVEKRNPGSLLEVMLEESYAFSGVYVRAHAWWDGNKYTANLCTGEESGGFDMDTLRRDATSIPAYLRLLGALASSHEVR